MADIKKIKRNLIKMISLNATDQEIDEYINIEGVTDEEVRGAKIDGSNIPKEQLEKKFIPQFTKGLFENVPFGKRVVSMLPHAEEIQQTMLATPEPKGILAKAGAVAGTVLPSVAAATPFMKGASLIPKVPGLIKSGIGLGLFSGTKAAAQRKPILPAAAKGAAAGIILGGAEKLGASLIPRQIPGAERIGSAAAGAVTGAATAEEGERVEGALFQAGLGLLTPSTRFGKLNARQVRVDQAIDDGISKGVKPSIAGKSSFSQLKRSKEQSRDAVKTIVENKGNLKLSSGNDVPKSLSDFAEATEQTRKLMYNQYSDLAEQAGQSGAVVDVKPYATSIRKSANSKALRTRNPSLSKQMNELADRIQAEGNLTPSEANESIASANVRLQSWFKNRTFSDADAIGVEAKATDVLRKSLDSAVEQTTGREFQILKNKFGALKSIEKDINKRVLIDGRKNIKGFFDLPDIFSNGQIARGILTLNPGDVVQGIAQKGIAAKFKQLNDQNTKIANMFRTVNKLHEAAPTSVTPEVLPKAEIPVSNQAFLQFKQRLALPNKPVHRRSPDPSAIKLRNQNTGEVIIVPQAQQKLLGLDPTKLPPLGTSRRVTGPMLGPKGRFGEPEFTVKNP